MINKVFEEIKVYFRSRESNPEEENPVKWFHIVPSVSVAIVLLVVIILLTKKYIRTRSQKRLDGSSVFTSEADPNSAEYIYRHVYRNHKNPIYLVPFSALPEDFDFSRSDIVVRGDYIILKDLHILEQPVFRPPSTPTTPTSPTFPSVSLPSIHMYSEVYKKQAPYNPNYNENLY